MDRHVFHHPLLKKFLRWVAGLATVLLLVIPIFFYRDFASVKEIGYIGYFFANYFGYGLYILPFFSYH